MLGQGGCGRPGSTTPLSPARGASLYTLSPPLLIRHTRAAWGSIWWHKYPLGQWVGKGKIGGRLPTWRRGSNRWDLMLEEEEESITTSLCVLGAHHGRGRVSGKVREPPVLCWESVGAVLRVLRCCHARGRGAPPAPLLYRPPKSTAAPSVNAPRRPLPYPHAHRWNLSRCHHR
jgi:hypothetical protein